MQNLDCANCAAKMETSIQHIPHVNSCSISFMAQKITIDITEDYIESTMKLVQKAVHKVDPECMILM